MSKHCTGWDMNRATILICCNCFIIYRDVYINLAAIIVVKCRLAKFIIEKYTTKERAEIVIIFNSNNKSIMAIKRNYRRKYRNRRTAYNMYDNLSFI